jgi:hypothetical protein
MTELQLQLGGHEKFVELCALYPTGCLSEGELAELRQHVEICQDCRTLLAEYQQLNQVVAPMSADKEAPSSVSVVRWDLEEAKRRLFGAIDGSEKGVGSRHVSPDSSVRWSGLGLRLPAPAVALGAAALIAVVLAVGTGYFAGFRKGAERSARAKTEPVAQGGAVAGVLTLVAEQKSLEKRIEDRDASIQQLSAKITQQSGDIARLTELLTHTASDDQQARSELSAAQANQTTAATDRNALQSQLNAAQGALTTRRSTNVRLI